MIRWRTIASLLAGVTLLATACGSDPGERASGGAPGPGGTQGAAGGEPGAGGQLSGTIAIDGSSTVAPMTDAIAEEYANEQPDVVVNLGVSGTGGGFERFCAIGDTDISNASRPIKQEEADRCQQNDIEFIELRIGTDALTMVVNPQSDFVDCLTTEDVVRIFGSDDPADTWKQVRSGFPDRPLTVFAPGTDSGTYDFMVEDVLDLDESRQDFNASENDNIIAQGIQGTPGSWGFFGFAYFLENQDTLKVLAYDAGEGCVEPSVETAQDDSYGMTRPLFLYVKRESLLDRPHVADFVRFYLGNVNSLIEDVGYIPVPDDQLDQARDEVDEALQGT